MLGINFKQIEGKGYRDDIGILAGTLYGNLENCHISNATINVEAIDDNFIGGIVGSNGGNIKNCTEDVDINANIAAAAGGIAGENSQYSQIIKCSNFGSINVDQLSAFNASSVGGIVGANYSIVDRCYNLGNVTCIKSTVDSGVTNEAIGGIVGLCWDKTTSVTNSYNKGTISGDRLVGGVVGCGGFSGTDSTGTNVYNSYSTGNIKCDDELKGNIIALNKPEGIVENCYYLRNGIQGIANNKEGATFSATEMTENQMKNQSFMEQLNLNDTAYLWNSNINDGYPYIDIEAPNIQVMYNKNDESSAVTVTLQANEKMKKKSGFELSEDGMQLVKTYFANYSEDVVIEDMNGNSTTVNIKIDGIVENDKQIYNIYTREDLIEISDRLKAGDSFENKTVNLMNDIEISDDESFLWEPLGTFSNPFKGTFLGNNHTISGIYSEGYTGEKGFFGVCSGATITKLNLDNISFTGYAEYVGGLVAYTKDDTIIKKCTVNANLNIDSSKRDTQDITREAGILVGETNDTIIQSCTTKGSNKLTTVYGDSVALGGMVGHR